MQTRINRSAQPSAAKPIQRLTPPADDSSEQPQLRPNAFVESLLEFVGGEPGNDPYNHTGRQARPLR